MKSRPWNPDSSSRLASRQAACAISLWSISRTTIADPVVPWVHTTSTITAPSTCPCQQTIMRFAGRPGINCCNVTIGFSCLLFHNANGSRSTIIRFQVTDHGIGRNMLVSSSAASVIEWATRTPYPPHVPSRLSTTGPPICSNHERKSSRDRAGLLCGTRISSSCATSCSRSRLSTTLKWAAAPSDRAIRSRSLGSLLYRWCNWDTTPSSHGMMSWGDVAAIACWSVPREWVLLYV